MAGPAEAVPDLYRRFADDWVSRRGHASPPMETAWLETFLAGLPERPRILDLGCGSGAPMAAWLIGRGAEVTGVDISGPLLAHARGRFPGHRWIEADMRGLDLGETFDGALAWHSAFHLTPEDLEGMFAVYARHVAPGGLLMFTSGGGRGAAIGEWNGEPLYHGSLAPEENRAGLEGAGFDILRHVARDPDCGGSTIWLARRRHGKVTP